MCFCYTAEGHFYPCKFRPPSQEYLRATGPKNVHAPQTLFFLPTEEYRALKKLHYSRSSTHENKDTSANHPKTPHRSSLKIHSQDIATDTKYLHRLQACNGPAVQYHTHADYVSGRPSKSSLKSNAAQKKKSTKFPILPVAKIDEPTLPPPVVS